MRRFLSNALGRNKQATPTEDVSVRGLPLMEGEQVQERFAYNQGIVGGSPKNGPLLLLTNLRVISFLRGGPSSGKWPFSNRETYLAPIGELRSVVVKGKPRGARNLIQGILFVLLGILAYFIIGYIRESTWSEISIASVVGVIIVVFGASYLGRHLLWEPEGEIVFQGGTWERSSPDNRGGVESYRWQMSFPYRSGKANDEVYTLVNRFFEIRSLNGHGGDVGLAPGSQTVAPLLIEGGLDEGGGVLPSPLVIDNFILSEANGGERATLESSPPEIWRLYVHGSPAGSTEKAASEGTPETTETSPPWRQYTYP